MEVWLFSHDALWTAPNFAITAASPPFKVRLSASASRAGGVAAANSISQVRHCAPYYLTGLNSIWMNPERCEKLKPRNSNHCAVASNATGSCFVFGGLKAVP
jgi:hypothetical protein